MTSLEIDPQFTQALRLLHSAHKDSAEQLRNLLDEAIRQKYGASKMLSNTLQKKYIMEETVLSDQSSTSSRKSKSSNSSKHSRSSKNSSPVTIQQEIPPDPLQTDDNLANLIEDVACVICKGMDVGAKNRLAECVKCSSLYHQECHTPHILDSQVDANVEWYCSNCAKTPPASKDRNSPKNVESKTKESKKSSSSSSKHSDKYRSSSSSNQSQNSNGSSSSSNSKVMPNINIVSADRRLKDMIKKAKQDKRGRSSNSSTSKHSSSKGSHDKSGK